MRWLFGVLLGAIFIFSVFFVADYTGHKDNIMNFIGEGYQAVAAEGELPSADLIMLDQIVDPDAGPTTSDAVRAAEDALNKANPNRAEDILREQQSHKIKVGEGQEVTIRAGSQDLLTPTLGKSIVNNVTEDEISTSLENIRLIISETADFRIDVAEIDELPQRTFFSVWPDSPVVDSSRPFYLMNPPNDIMDAYKLKHVVEDEGDLYAKAFEVSEGIFVRKLDALAEVNPFSTVIYQQLAQKRKSLVVYNAYFDPNFSSLLRETQADFHRVDYVFDQNSSKAPLSAQWTAMLRKAQHGEEILVLYEIDQRGLAPLSKVIEMSQNSDQ